MSIRIHLLVCFFVGLLMIYFLLSNYNVCLLVSYNETVHSMIGDQHRKVYFLDVSINRELRNLSNVYVYVTDTRNETAQQYCTLVHFIMSLDSKKSFLLSCLKTDPLSVDFLLSCFSAALSSYRHDTVLKPFPGEYVLKDEQKDFALLKKHFDKIVKVTNITPASIQAFELPVINILHWLLEAKRFRIRSCSKDKFALIEALTGQMVSVTPPNFVFEVVYNSVLEDKFQDLKGSKKLLYAYHGSRMENFYSILNHGLQQNLSKNALFGEGIYLAGELSVSLPYSPNGASWDSSIIGQKMSCIAVCELIDDPTGVKCQEESKDTATPGSKSRSHIAGSMGGEIPEKYYVVRNNELVRVKYLLVYAEKTKSKSLENSWIYQHKFAVMIIFYALILLMVGLYTSKTFHIYIKKLLR